MEEEPMRLPLRRRPVQEICAMDCGEDVLDLILERVDSVVSLIRAASVCKRWRRAIADAAFLRRFRSLHAPTVAGYYHNGTRLPHPASGVGAAPTEGTGRGFVPSSPSMDARHFSLDFLPDRGESWNIVDSRGCLLLMQRWGDANSWVGIGFPDCVVCEPLTRRYRRVPFSQLEDFNENCRFIRPFLIDGVMDQMGNCIGLSNFRMLCLFQRNSVSHTAVFMASDESNCSWSKMAICQAMPSLGVPLGRVGSSWYFYIQGGMLIVLNRGTGVFSASMLPAIEDWDIRRWRSNVFIIEGRDGKPRMLTLFDDNLKVFARLDGGEWALEKRVLLSEVTRSLPGYQPSFFSSPQRVLTVGVGFIILSPPKFLASEGQWAFSLDLETMEAAPAVRAMGYSVYQLEFPWPPSLHTCLD
ncbi:hypothetical protein EJB05_00767 [Eragrostis curvula]|uniref:F-box domain-containing protein n=1 Tax=Eragrostis curvula TaxID=38414 RepID=A0A5J9WQ88_9POAL|nr:hypothetical protein EJB05_00767 [Eragrostis curvula]